MYREMLRATADLPTVTQLAGTLSSAVLPSAHIPALAEASGSCVRLPCARSCLTGLP